jgi:hypothetical protein
VPVGVTGHRTQRPRGQVGPPGPHPAQPSSSLNAEPRGRTAANIAASMAPLIAQLVGGGGDPGMPAQTSASAGNR